MSNELEQLQAENVALREVLKWYSSAQRYKLRKEVHSAYGRSWDVPVISEIDADQGKRARNAFSRSSPAAERVRALEEEHKLALTLCQRIDDTVGDVKDFAECVDRQHAAYEAWRTVVEKVKE